MVRSPCGCGFRKACDTTGTSTNDGISEAWYDFDVAVRLVRILRSEGARVVLTRKSNDGVGPCIDERAAIGNRAHADAAISIHADGGPPGGRGFDVIYKPNAPASHRLALAVRRAFAVITGEQVLDIRDFAIPSPTVLMLRIYPDVRVRLQVEAEPEDAP